MAEPDGTAPGGTSPLKKDILRKLKAAETEKRLFEADFQECYGFMMPHRVKPGYGSQSTRPGDANDNFTTLGEEVTTDFASDFADTFAPEHSNWGGIEVAEAVDESIQDDVKEQVDKENKIMFDAINASDFSERVKQGGKDLAVSAFGMVIQEGGPGMPIHCQVIPINELFILRDPNGGIGTRYWKRKMAAEDIASTFPDLRAKFSSKLKTAIVDGKSTIFPVVQGCHRDYTMPAETAWMVFTMIDGDVLEATRKIGQGCEPIQVCRWDPDPSYAWGNGVGMKALAEFRGLDETAYLRLKGMARIIDPPVAFTDDSVINLEGGLTNGVAIPMMEGSKIEVIESEHSVDAVLFATKDSVDRIRRLFYLDEPDQLGKTPPTAYQWQDETLRRQRRLGTPAAPIWPEFLSQVILRFRYLLVQRGELKPGLPVGGNLLPIRPMNPLKRAAQQEEAMAVERFVTSLNNLLGPELIPQVIDVGKTVTKWRELSHATGVTLNPPAQINDAIQKMFQAQMAQAAAKTAAPVLSATKGAVPQ